MTDQADRELAWTLAQQEDLSTIVAEHGHGTLDVDIPWQVDLSVLEGMPEHEREEWLSKLQAFNAGIEANPLWQIRPHQGELGYKLKNGIPLTGREGRGQEEFLDMDRRGIYMGAAVASNRWGKTHIALVRAAIQTLPRHFVPPWLLPYKTLDPEKRDVRFLFAGRDSTNWLPRVIKSKLTGRRAIIAPAALHKGNFRDAWNGKERSLTFADGSVWWFVTYDMDTQAWAGSDVDGVSFDEEPVGEDGKMKYEEAVGRTIDREGDLRFTLTPVEGIGWLAEELTDENGDPRRDDECHVVTGEIDHNPHLSERGKQRAIARWKKNPATFDARTKGAWVYREGLIFPEYRRSLEQPPVSEHPGGHVRADRPLYAPGTPSPRDEHGAWQVPVFESIDPGINDEHPFAFTIAFLNTPATDLFGNEDVLEVFYALKIANTIVAEQAGFIKEARAIFGYRPQFTTIDPAARSRNPATGKTLMDAFRAEGIHCVPGQNSRELTYAELRGRITTHRYRVWSSADEILGDELTKYRWKKNKSREESVASPQPIKRNDDAIDTQRYMVVRIPVFQGRTPDADGFDDDDPRKALLKRHVSRLVHKRGRKGKVGGAWS